MIWLGLVFAAQNEPITLNAPISSLETICRQLSDTTGRTIETNTLRDVPVLVQVNQVPLRKLLDQLAEVTGGTVIVNDRAFMLERTAAQRTADLKAEQRDIVARLAPALEKLKQTYPASLDWSDEGVRTRRAKLAEAILKEGFIQPNDTTPFTLEVKIGGITTPAAAMLAAVVSQIRPEQLALVKPNETLRFSDRASALQLPLNVNLAKGKMEFLSAHNRMVQGSLPGVPGHVQVNAGFPWRRLEEADLRKVTLLVRWQGTSRFTLGMRVIGREGELLGSDTVSLTMENAAPMPIQLEGPELISWPKEGVQLAALLKAQNERLGFQISQASDWGNGRRWELGKAEPPVPITPEIRTRLLSVNTQDPQEDFLAVPFRQIAATRKLNLVARLRDADLLNMSSVVSAQPKSVTEFGKEIARLLLVIETKDGWLTVRPKFMSVTERADVPRDAWWLMARGVADDNVSFNIGARYARRAPFTDPVKKWVSLLNASAADRAEDGYPAFRFQALLPRQAGSDPVAYVQAPDAFRYWLTTNYLNDFSEFGGSSFSRNDPPRRNLALDQDLSESLDVAGVTLLANPVARGPFMILQARRTAEAIPQWISPFGLGRTQASRNMPQYAEYADFMRPFDQYRAGTVRYLGWHVMALLPGEDLASGSRNGSTVEFRSQEASGDWVTEAQLPEAYQKEIQMGVKGTPY